MTFDHNYLIALWFTYSIEAVIVAACWAVWRWRR